MQHCVVCNAWSNLNDYRINAFDPAYCPDTPTFFLPCRFRQCRFEQQQLITVRWSSICCWRKSVNGFSCPSVDVVVAALLLLLLVLSLL